MNTTNKYLNILSMMYLVFFLSAAILAHKLVYFANYMTSVSTFILPFTFVLADVIAEVYGYRAARNIIWSALLCEFIFAMIMYIAVQIHSPSILDNTDAYKEVFGTFLRIFIGNFTAMILATFLNIYFLLKWKFLLKGKYFWLRSLFSSAIGEFTFTVTCVIIAFLGVIPTYSIPQLILTSFLFKCIFNPIAVMPATLLMTYIKARENIGTETDSIDFNPFKRNNLGDLKMNDHRP